MTQLSSFGYTGSRKSWPRFFVCDPAGSAFFGRAGSFPARAATRKAPAINGTAWRRPQEVKMLRSSKRVLWYLVAGFCCLLIVADAQAGIFRRGQNGRSGIFGRRANNRSATTTTATTAAAAGATVGGQAATTGAGSNLSVRGQSPEGTETPRTGAYANPAAQGVTPPPQLPAPSGAQTPRPQ